jgi:glycosyltransferase involved in cell wall biosynthesis
MLSIQIPTVEQRKITFRKLYTELKEQSKPYGNDIEIIYLRDNKELPIGEKRNKLYEMATKKYSLQYDDDDWIHKNGIELIMNELYRDVDCFTYNYKVHLDDGRYIYREKNSFGVDYIKQKNFNGFNNVHPPTPKCIFKTSLARQVKLDENLRYGEDGFFAIGIKPLINSSFHIDKYIYEYKNLSGESFDDPARYGMTEKTW